MSSVLFRSPLQDEIVCDLCGGEDFSMMHAWPVGNPWNPASVPISVWKCGQCELVILHPVPSPEELPGKGDWHSKKRKGFCRRKWFKKRWEPLRHALFGKAEQRMLKATRRAMPRGRLLDIGCGKGDLLNFASRHYECVGLEPSRIAAKKALRSGHEVIEARIESAEIKEASFDVVTMSSVIEHVASPRQVLAKVNFLLRPGGVVALLTPKFGGPAYRMHGEGWNGFRHGYHTFLFTGHSLSRYLEQAGFEVLARPKRDRVFDDLLILWGRKVSEAAAPFTPQFRLSAA